VDRAERIVAKQAGLCAVIYRHIRADGRMAALVVVQRERPTVFLCRGARGVNVRTCRDEGRWDTRCSPLDSGHQGAVRCPAPKMITERGPQLVTAARVPD
jgi:hypothetical protein